MKDLCLNKIKQHFTDNSLPDIKGKLSAELLKLKPLLKPGNRIALAVGSRGIKNLATIVREVAAFIRDNNAYPFIVPAMGSHGNASAAGQTEILAGYGISEKTMGLPVLSSMEVVGLTRGDSQFPVFMDKYAYESDGVIIINRVKPHTDFHGIYESGLVKMSVIGLGKEKQASAVHEYGVYGLSALIPKAAELVFSSGKIIGGIALVENSLDNIMLLKVLKTDEFFEKEPELLELARKNMPSLPVDDIDVLIIDQMGKDICGVGIDPNIIGRIRISGQKEPEKPVIKAIITRDLSDGSHGNAIGIGLSDVITRKLYNKIDFSSTYKNAVTSTFLDRAKIPLIAENDKEAVRTALRSCGHLEKGKEKIIRIKDTLHLDEMYVSVSVTDSLRTKKRIEVLKEDVKLFDKDNNITEF